MVVVPPPTAFKGEGMEGEKGDGEQAEGGPWLLAVSTRGLGEKCESCRYGQLQHDQLKCGCHSLA